MKKDLKTIKKKSMAGLTLVEVLVALAISLLLGTGVYQIFVGTTRSYAMNEDLARLQENGRFALHFLRSEVRGAGYLGCLQDVSKVTNALNGATDFVYDFQGAIYGAEALSAGGWADSSGAVNPLATGTNAMALNPAPLAGSDLVVVRGIRSDIPISIITGMPPTSADMKLTAGLAALGILDTGGGDILMISDCEAAAIFQTTSYTDSNGNTVHNTGTGSPGNATKDLGKAFGAGAQIFFPQTAIFYIANNPGGEPALFRKIGTVAAAMEIIAGVENMQVRYGEDTSGNGAADVYRNANQVVDWTRVMSVRIGVLLRSAISRDPSAPVDNAQYDVSGDGNTDFTAPGDRRMRMVFSGTIALRNRVR